MFLTKKVDFLLKSGFLFRHFLTKIVKKLRKTELVYYY